MSNDYKGTNSQSAQVCELMRRINALEAGTSGVGGKWRFYVGNQVLGDTQEITSTGNPITVAYTINAIGESSTRFPGWIVTKVQKVSFTPEFVYVIPPNFTTLHGGSVTTSEGVETESNGTFEFSVADTIGQSEAINVYSGAFVRWFTENFNTINNWILTFYYEEYTLAGIETEWLGYDQDDSESLGTPDGGASVPIDNALVAAISGGGCDSISKQIVDMRAAIAQLVSSEMLLNPATSNPYNWTSASADNLYYVAMGDRTKYGATGGAAYDWTRTEAEMNGTSCYDIDIGEIFECVRTLEEAVS